MNYMALFFTHSGAIKFNEVLKTIGINGTLMPVPRVLSSNCGISVKFSFNDKLEDLINEDIDKIYQISDKNSYSLVYSE